MLTSHLFPFYSLSNYQLHNEFQSIKEKLEEVINNSVLSDFLKFLKPYYHQIGFESKYFNKRVTFQIFGVSLEHSQFK